MDKKVIAVVAVVSLVLIGTGVVLATRSSAPKFSHLDDFAKCLADKGAVMYGAYWCPHCQAQKKQFGDSFQYVNYVECTVSAQKCTDAKISGYPTWIFADGKRSEGEQSLDTLSQVTSCPLPAKTN